MNELNQFIITFGGSIMVIMMGVIGWFLARLVKIVDRLEETVNNMQISYAVQQSKISEIEKNCAARYKTLLQK